MGPMARTVRDLAKMLDGMVGDDHTAFLGRPFAELSLIRLAYAYEQATRHRQRPATTPELEAKTPSTSSRLNRP
jgi:Asp-tRNA(Asn)/Glu-tRNA(Gln) amidotransferase A subunit family amidase